MTAQVTILVVDDFDPFRRYVNRLFEPVPEYKIVGEALDGLEALRLAESLRPSLILLDIGIPGLDGFEVAKRLASISPESAIIFVTLEHSAHAVAQALSLGAAGYVWKFDAGLELLPAIRSVLGGQRYFSREIQLLMPPGEPR